MGKKIILAFVGMPGAGKSEASLYLQKKGIPFVRFGDITDEGVKEQGLPLTQEHEREFRERIRKELGMAAYAIKSEPKIEALLATHDTIAIDGLRSWEEYTFLKEKFPFLCLICIYAEPTMRAKRLFERAIRPLTAEEAHARDVAELVHLHMGGPIALADHLIVNDDSNLDSLYKKIDALLERLGIVL